MTSEKYHEQNIKHKFGIDRATYLKMLEDQSGLCAICEVHHSAFKRRLAVDHDHHTGKVRGLLCQSCNSGMGKLQDNVDLLESAILYLENGPRFLTRVVKTPEVTEI